MDEQTRMEAACEKGRKLGIIRIDVNGEVSNTTEMLNVLEAANKATKQLHDQLDDKELANDIEKLIKEYPEIYG